MLHQVRDRSWLLFGNCGLLESSLGDGRLPPRQLVTLPGTIHYIMLHLHCCEKHWEQARTYSSNLSIDIVVGAQSPGKSDECSGSLLLMMLLPLIAKHIIFMVDLLGYGSDLSSVSQSLPTTDDPLCISLLTYIVSCWLPRTDYSGAFASAMRASN
jgi:hypothetical protein